MKIVAFVCLFILNISGSLFAQTKLLTMEDIFSRPYLIGTRPTNASLSPDGKYITFHWNESGGDSLYLFSSSVEKPNPKKVSKEKNARLVSWSKDGSYFLFSEKGDIYRFQLKNNQISRVTQSADFLGSIIESDEKDKVSFVTGNHLHILSKNDPLIVKKMLTKEDGVSASLVGQVPGKSKYIIRLSKTDSVKHNLVPQWMGTVVTTINSSRFSTTYRKYQLVDAHDTVKTIDLSGKNMHSGYGGSTAISSDGKWFAFDNIDMQQKNRPIILVNLETNQLDTIFVHSDTAWVNTFSGFGFSSDSKTFAFTHEMTNWNHIYQYQLSTKKITQLTTGNYEVEKFEWHPKNPELIYMISTENSSSDRQLWQLNVNTGKREVLTIPIGMKSLSSVSGDGNFLAFTHSSLSEVGDLFVLDVKKKKTHRITSSMPNKLNDFILNYPTEIKINNNEIGTSFATHVFYPQDYDKNKKYPVVIFVHGAGYLQNVMNTFGYGSYWREYLFNMYLAQQGYIVLNIDFSGSSGYGRENRISIYKDMGGADWSDCVAAANYAVNELNGDANRIGIYGGSYGGFLTMMALFKSPDTFKAGAALRSVANWELYNRWYTEQRLGSLKSNKSIYEKTSPITYAENLKHHLLILHGMVDDNVLFQDVVQLMEKLIKLNKKFDVMIYPTERHSFTEPEAWLHEYLKIEEHFNRYLK